MSLIGHSLGRYHILEQLGEGGMAVVYKARDTRLEADVALKVIRTENILPSALERTLKRFEREAKALARLTHPNIVKVTDYGEHEGKPYLVMPLLSGGTLKSKLNGKPMPWQEAAQILIPIADALGYAHKHDIIHRDVKPANILITENGQPMLADFGVAKILEVEETMELTGTGVGVGTPEYMAPEQVTNKMVDARVDIYALGIVLFEMIMGRKPFIADTPMAVLFKHASDPLPRPRSLIATLPQAVENVIIKSLAKRPEDRFQSMAEFAKAMEELSSGKKITEYKKRGGFKFPAIPRRAAITVGLIAFGVGLLAVFSKSLLAIPAQLFATSTPSNTPTSTFTATPNATNTPLITAAPTLGIGSAMTGSDGMTLLYVPAGEFMMGAADTNLRANDDERPEHTVYLDAFWIDKTESTNAMYALCVQAGACQLPFSNRSETRESYFDNNEYANYPVIFVGWDDAKSYCSWVGRRLPTESEWEKAARDTDRRRMYPWGNNEPTCDIANINMPNGLCIGDTTQVGSYPSGISPYGALDMIGNVDEWVADWHSATYYSLSPINNPAGPTSGLSRVLRGGSWSWPTDLRATNRYKSGPTSLRSVFGFRCVISAGN